MDRSDVLTLVAHTKTQDEFGRWITTDTTHDVYVQVDSITRAEYFDAGRNGHNPEFRFRMFSGDYNGEPVCFYHNMPFAIYRTYQRRNDIIELYVERKGGTNGETDHS